MVHKDKNNEVCSVTLGSSINKEYAQLIGGRGAGKFAREGEYQLKKEITTIVDADDRNCLAELTVVLKFNQSR
ncbi:MAG TPA: hypothetical protein VIS75_14370 [Chitinophagaceae bacterium]